jgi:hypothetical protein
LPCVADLPLGTSVTYPVVQLKDFKAARRAVVSAERAIVDDIEFLGLAR